MTILAIVNAVAKAYSGVIPADRWHEPYMPRDDSITRSAYQEDGTLLAFSRRAPGTTPAWRLSTQQRSMFGRSPASSKGTCRAEADGRSLDWLKSKNPASEVVRREAEGDWGR